MQIAAKRRVVGLGLLAALCGCGAEEGVDMAPVHGSVSWEGKPLSTGNIVLEPEDGKGSPIQGAISEGKFDLKSPPGSKIVRIQASRDTGKIGEYGEKISESYIPAKYNRTSKLKAAVVAGEENELKFELK
jgi:hypothetical protein